MASGSNDTTVLVWDVAGVKREPKTSVAELQPKEIEVLWADLVGGDARKAFSSVLTLAASKRTSAFLGERLKPAAPVDPKLLDALIADLDSAKFPVRKKATDELEKLGDLAMPALQKVVNSQPTLEARMRVEPLIEKLTTGVLGDEQVRLVRRRSARTARRRGCPATIDHPGRGCPGHVEHAGSSRGTQSLEQALRRDISGPPRKSSGRRPRAGRRRLRNHCPRRRELPGRHCRDSLRVSPAWR